MAESLGERIKHLRLSLFMTQDEMALRTRLPITALSQWETGARIPSIKNLCKLIRALGCTADYLLFGEVSLKRKR